MNLKIFSDGGARGNPGHAGIGFLIFDEANLVFAFQKYIGQTTNNVAEYTAVYEALNYLLLQSKKTQNISFFLDSELVVRQLSGIYKIKTPHLQSLWQKIQQQISQLQKQGLKNISFQHIPREENKKADYLVNQAIDSFLKSTPKDAL